MPSPLWIFGTALTILALGLLIWKGGRPEREAAAGLIVVQLVSGWVDHLVIGQFRWAVAAVSVSLLVWFVRLSLRYDRWWLLFAAGAQLLAFGTHVASLFGSDVLTWSIVTTRMVVWVEIMILGLIGVWEATSAPYARPQTSLSAKSRIA
jgi:hypothetical protein